MIQQQLETYTLQYCKVLYYYGVFVEEQVAADKKTHHKQMRKTPSKATELKDTSIYRDVQHKSRCKHKTLTLKNAFRSTLAITYLAWLKRIFSCLQLFVFHLLLL